MIKMLYSTMYLGHGASGSQRMFTVPEGHPMAMMTGPHDHCAACGRTGTPVIQTREHTNMSRAGVIGENTILTAMRACTSDGSTPELAYQVLVGGRQVLGGSLRELLGNHMFLPGLKVGADDTFEVIIAVPSGKALERPVTVLEQVARVRKFKPFFFGLGREVYVDETVKTATRLPFFLKVEFWANVVACLEEP